MVEPNNSFAFFVALSFPTSTNIRWRSDNNSVSGPNMGCNEVTIQPLFKSDFNPSLSGVFNEPISNISPSGLFFDNSSKIFAEISIGVATTIISKFTPAFRQSENENSSSFIFLSATKVLNP